MIKYPDTGYKPLRRAFEAGYVHDDVFKYFDPITALKSHVETESERHEVESVILSFLELWLHDVHNLIILPELHETPPPMCFSWIVMDIKTRQKWEPDHKDMPITTRQVAIESGVLRAIGVVQEKKHTWIGGRKG